MSNTGFPRSDFESNVGSDDCSRPENLLITKIHKLIIFQFSLPFWLRRNIHFRLLVITVFITVSHMFISANFLAFTRFVDTRRKIILRFLPAIRLHYIVPAATLFKRVGSSSDMDGFLMGNTFQSDLVSHNLDYHVLWAWWVYFNLYHLYQYLMF